MYRRVLLGAVSSVALLSSAFAADIYTPSAPAYAAVAFPPTWGGFYLGVNGGYGGNSGLGFRDNVFFPTLPAGDVNPYSTLSSASTIAGGFGGGQLGYNFQWGPLVAGFETDIQGSGIRGSGAEAIINPTTGGTGGPGGVCQATVASPGGLAGGACAGKSDLNVEWFGTVRGRLGYAFGGTLLYATGGFAYGGVNSSFSYADNNAGAAPQLLVGRVSNSTTQTGWAAGAGIEQKISPSWSVKGEYQFVDLGSVTTGPSTLLVGTSPAGTDLRGQSRVQFNTVRIGVNYLFNAPEPLPLK